jgi:hypothetical protein
MTGNKENKMFTFKELVAEINAKWEHTYIDVVAEQPEVEETSMEEILTKIEEMNKEIKDV